jgi:negative regulator of flagellin synthesis FlgM
MNVKTVLGINQPYGQGRVGRGESSEAPGTVTRGTGTEAGATSADRVTISGDAKLVALAGRAAQDASDVRTDKVASLKAQVEAGTYQPDSRKIAEKMLTMESELFD